LTFTVERVEPGVAEGEWRELLACCDPAYPFLSPTWQRIWWEELGARSKDDPSISSDAAQDRPQGERREGVLLRVSDGGKACALAPLMRDGQRLTWAGDTSICDYMDVVGAKEGRAELLEAVIRALSEEPWSELVLWAVREDSPTFKALPYVCKGLGLMSETEVEDVCPQLDLPGDWEEYLAGLDKKDRHELRRKLRKLSQGGEPELEVLTSSEEVSAAMDDFMRQHRTSRADKDTFMTPQMEGFFRKVVPALAAEGSVEMTFLKLGGVRAASVLCFRTDGDLLLYNSGYEKAYAQLSVGLLSKALALQRAIEQGMRRFDFLRGAEPYKYDLGAKDVAVYRCVVKRER
jgi:CelD/BcsL family acetyltransferase involved in cellulose biosynthesis